MAGLYLYLNRIDDFLEFCSEAPETKLMETYFVTQTAVDGKLGRPAMSVDGINWEMHLEILELMKTMARNGRQS